MNTQPLTLDQINNKIAKFQEGLGKAFVPDDEKAMYRDAIKKLESQRAVLLLKNSSEASVYYRVETTPESATFRPSTQQATNHPDQEQSPADPKKKMLPEMLVVWADNFRLKILLWLERVALGGRKRKNEPSDHNNQPLK